MKQDTLTTREKAELWWNELPDFTKDELNIKYWFDTIETIYAAEHPEQPLPEETIKEQSSNRGEGDIWFMNSIDEDCAVVSDNKGFILEAPDMETGKELCKRWNESSELAKENKKLRSDMLNAIRIEAELRESNTRLKEENKRLMDNMDIACRLALEFGYVECEKGNNIQLAFKNYASCKR